MTSRPPKGTTIACETCGVEAYVMPCHIGKKKYCSNACKDKAKERSVPKPCAMCGKEFTEPPCKNQQFCSWECFQKSLDTGKQCKTCGKPLRISARTYCSKSCMWQDEMSRAEIKPCEICGKEIRIVASDAGHKRFCSRKCANEGHKLTGPGATFKNADGYIAVYYPTHPDAHANGMILQHRLVVEQRVGRRLLKTEVVHHINGIRDDNRDSNLELVKHGEHSSITNREAKQKRLTQREELAEYEKRFGPLPD